MTFDYARSRATAERLLARFGQAGALREPGEPTGPAYNPTPGEPTYHPCTCVVLEYDLREVDGSSVLATDRKVLISTEGLAVEPSTERSLLLGGTEHAIISVRPLSPAGTVLLWEAQIRD